MLYTPVMVQEIRDAFLSYSYQKLLDNYGRLIPRRFLKTDRIPKNGLEFLLYLKIIDAYVYTLKRIQERGRAFAIKLQEQRLRKILRIANGTSWWSRYFSSHAISIEDIKNLTDFKRIPPVNRLSLVDVPKQDILTLPTEDPSIVWRRSGGSTTGTPFVWGLNKSLLQLNVLAHFIKELENEGFPFDHYKEKDFYIDYNWPHGFRRSEFKWFSGGDFVMRTDDADVSRKIRSLSQLISQRGTAVVRTSPSELPFLIQELREQELHPPISFFTITGQILEEDTRKLATDYLGCKIIVHYGAQEMGPLTIECKHHHGFYHIFSERTIIEILDEEGETVASGIPGNITVTCLDNTVMPLIRYQPGDVGILHYDMSCTCENKSPLLEIKSRDTDVIKFKDGRSESARSILRRFSAEPYISRVRRFQVRQDQLNEVKILLEIRAPLPAEVIELLKREIIEKYDQTLSVVVEQTDHIYQDGPKFKVFVPLKKGAIA